MLYIFDMGGVVTENFLVVPKMAEQFGISSEKFFNICDKNISQAEKEYIGLKDKLPDNNYTQAEKGETNSKQPESTSVRSIDRYSIGLIASLCRGDITAENFWSIFNLRSGFTAKSDYWRLFFCPKINEGTVQLISSLHKKGRVVCGTNTMTAHYEVHLQRCDYSIFDRVYASQQMGVIKPDPNFWKMILLAENAAPEETVFFDDNQENVETAFSIGIKSHLFTTVEDAKLFLQEIQHG